MGFQEQSEPRLQKRGGPQAAQARRLAGNQQQQAGRLEVVSVVEQQREVLQAASLRACEARRLTRGCEVGHGEQLPWTPWTRLVPQEPPEDLGGLRLVRRAWH